MTTPLLNLKYFFFPKCIKLQVNTPSEGWVAASSGWEEDVQGKEAHGDPEEYMGYGVRSLLFHQLQVPLLHLPYEGLSLSKFLYSLCKKHVRFALATTALPTGEPLSKQTSKEIFLWLRLFHYRKKKKQTNRHTHKKKGSIKGQLPSQLWNLQFHLPDTTQMSAGWQSAGTGSTPPTLTRASC